MNELLIYATKWMNLKKKSIQAKEVRYQKITYLMIPFLESCQTSPSRQKAGQWPGVQGKLVAKEIRELCGIVETFCILIMMVISQV